MIELEYEGSVFKTKNSGDLIITKYVNSRMVHVRFFNTGYESLMSYQVNSYINTGVGNENN